MLYSTIHTYVILNVLIQPLIYLHFLLLEMRNIYLLSNIMKFVQKVGNITLFCYRILINETSIKYVPVYIACIEAHTVCTRIIFTSSFLTIVAVDPRNYLS